MGHPAGSRTGALTTVELDGVALTTYNAYIEALPSSTTAVVLHVEPSRSPAVLQPAHWADDDAGGLPPRRPGDRSRDALPRTHRNRVEGCWATCSSTRAETWPTASRPSRP
ncbi:hypothetical protein [Demequina litorisediminis]|uniref:hypothetical protein n=1 Tax=Demequina litorisediminis TaxID=1849022 RepID=UPI0024E0E66C|nr:hypothetical protein [Demequina litorisediminis]